MPTFLGAFRKLTEKLVDRHARRACLAPRSTRFLPSTLVRNNSSDQRSIRFGERCVVGGQFLVYPDCGEIQIGDDCFIGPETRIWSGSSVQVGNRVLISHGVNIHDNISHSLSARERHQHFIEILHRGNGALGDVRSAPIVIEDDVWVGFNAVILKGVRIGRGAVVAAGTMVTKDIPSFAIVAGPNALVVGQASE